MNTTVTATTTRVRTVVGAFLRSDFYEVRCWGNSSDDVIDDEERWERCQIAAEHGADGSYHAEVIDDMRRVSREWLRERSRQHSGYHDGYPRLETALEAYWDGLESWHDANGSLWQEVG